MAKIRNEKEHWATMQENMRQLLVDMIERDKLTQAEIAQSCGWYNKHKKPDQSRVSSYTTGTKFSAPAYAWMCKCVWDLSLVDFFAAATNSVDEVEDKELNKAMSELGKNEKKAILDIAKVMAVNARKLKGLKK